jgi:hypothetical protein
MRNKAVDIELGGETRHLRLNLNAIASFEEATGNSIGAMRDELGRVPVRALRILLWALLVTDDPKLTINQVGSWVELDNLQYVSEQVTEVLRSSGRKERADNSPPLASTQAATAGASSSPSEG